MTDTLQKIKQLADADIAAPLGFHADGQHVGLKHKSKDLGWIYSDVPAAAAGVFTTNQVQTCAKPNYLYSNSKVIEWIVLRCVLFFPPE